MNYLKELLQNLQKKFWNSFRYISLYIHVASHNISTTIIELLLLLLSLLLLYNNYYLLDNNYY